MKTILVTGGAGFIGSTLADRLLACGHKVVSLDNFDSYYPRKLKEKNIESAARNENFVFVEGDVRDCDFLKNVMKEKEIDMVFHLAARAGVRASIENPEIYNDINIRGAISLAKACLDSSVKKMVYSSSSSVYGNSETLPIAEEHPTNPISPYGVSKLAAEKYIFSFQTLYGIEAACLRLFTVYGPRQRPDEAICKFAKLAIENRVVEIYGDGNATRDFTYVDDIVSGHIAAMDSRINRNKSVFNLGSGKSTTVSEIVELLEKALGKKFKIKYVSRQKGDVSDTLADIRRAKEHLGWEPKIGIGEGISRFAAWALNAQK